MTRHVMLLLAIASFAIFRPSSAQAVTAGETCAVAGATQASNDQRSMLACLYYGSHSMVWTPLASMPVYGQAGSDRVGAGSTPGGQVQPERVDARSRWQGWYAGAAAGYAGTTNSFNDVATNVGGSASPEDLDIDGGTAGLVGGYNRVSRNGLFYGGEADINYMTNTQHVQYSDGVTGNPAEAKSVWNGYATLRGRLGFALDPGLIFLTGGLALANVRDSYSFPTAYPVVTGFSQQNLEIGWTAGAGAEFALTPRVSLSAEYLRLQIPASSNEMAADNGAPLKFRLQDSANILRAGVNWHFD